MNFEKINQSFSIIANIGVLAGIVFLALEIQQNTAMMKAQTRNDMTQNQMGFFERVIDNSDVAQSFSNSNNSISEVPDEELTQLYFLVYYQLRMWENEWYQYQQGLFEEEEFAVRLTLWESQLNRASHEWVWDQIGRSFSTDFRDLIDGMRTQ